VREKMVNNIDAGLQKKKANKKETKNIEKNKQRQDRNAY